MTWKDISISKFEQIHYIFNSDLTDIEKVVEIWSILNNCSSDSIYNLPKSELDNISKEVDYFFKSSQETNISPVYVINGTKYNLTTSADKMIAGQYIDYTNTLESITEHNYWQKASLLLAILLIPKGYKYNNGYDIIKLQDEIYNSFSIIDAKAITNFFFLLLKSCIKVTQTSLILKLKKKLKKEKNPTKRIEIENLIKTLSKDINMS